MTPAAASVSDTSFEGWTVPEAAAAWGVSDALIRKWIKQGRLRSELREEIPRRTKWGQVVIVLDRERPPRAKMGELTQAQRKAWPDGGMNAAKKRRQAAIRALRGDD